MSKSGACVFVHELHFKMVLEYLTSSGQDGDKNDHVTRFVRWTKSRGQTVLFYAHFKKIKPKFGVEYIFKLHVFIQIKKIVAA